MGKVVGQLRPDGQCWTGPGKEAAPGLRSPPPPQRCPPTHTAQGPHEANDGCCIPAPPLISPPNPSRGREGDIHQYRRGAGAFLVPPLPTWPSSSSACPLTKMPEEGGNTRGTLPSQATPGRSLVR